MKKIMIVQGGGRPNGNTAQLVAAFEKGATEAGHDVEISSLVFKRRLNEGYMKVAEFI